MLGSRPVEALCGAIGVALLVVVILAGYVGRGSALDNLAPTFILIDFWVGLVFASVLFGDVFRAFSPWRAIRLPGIRPLPRALGPLPGRARAARVHLDRARVGLGRDAGGPDHRGGRLHRLHARDAGGLRHRDVDAPRRGVRRLLQPLLARCRCGRRATASSACARRSAGCRGSTRRPGTVLFVVVMIGTVTFDGFSQGQLWKDFSVDLADALDGLVGLDAAPKVVATLGLLAGVAVIGAFYRLGIDGARSVGGDLDAAGAAARVHPHARPDRDGLRRRPLPDVPAVRGAGDVLPGVGPVRRRAGTCSAPPTARSTTRT